MRLLFGLCLFIFALPYVALTMLDLSLYLSTSIFPHFFRFQGPSLFQLGPTHHHFFKKLRLHLYT